MSIVIEGCDCTGKTSFHKALNWPVIKGNKFKRGRDSLDHWDKIFEPGYNIISRWWPTEYIYGNTFRGGSAVTLGDMCRYKMTGDLYGTMLLWMQLPWEQIRDRHIKRGDTQSLRYMEKIWKAYISFFNTFIGYLPPMYDISQMHQLLFDHAVMQNKAAKYQCFDMDSVGTLKGCKNLICGKGVTQKTFFDVLAKSDFYPGTTHVIDLLSLTCGNWEAAIDFLEPEKITAIGVLTAEKLGAAYPSTYISMENFCDYTQT